MVRDANGDATAVQSWYAPTPGNNMMPCHDAVAQASIAKAAGIIVYTIGYDLGSGNADTCNIANGGGTEPGITHARRCRRWRPTPASSTRRQPPVRC